MHSDFTTGWSGALTGCRYIQARSGVARWCVGGEEGGAKHVISGLNQWCSQDNTCSNARTAWMCVAYYMQIYETMHAN